MNSIQGEKQHHMIDLQHIKDTITSLNEPTLTMYLHVDNARRENQADNPAWRIELKNMLGEYEQANRTAWQNIRSRVETFFEDYQPSAKTLVLFADNQQLHWHELPVQIESQGNFGEPLLMPLLWVIDEFERYLVVQIDAEKARFISGYLGMATEHSTMQMELDDYDFGERTLMPANYNQPESSASAPGGNAREQYNSMIDAHRERFYKEVVTHLDSLGNELGNPRVILSGDEKAAHELQTHLSAAIRQRFAGVTPVPFQLEEHDVLNEIMDTALVYERSLELELVNRIINDAKAGGRAALGHADVVQAIMEQRVETLVLPYPPSENDLANEMKLKAFEAGTTIELVHGTPAAKLESEGGVGAVLHYTYETAT